MPQADGYFDQNGTALTKEQRLARSERKGLCPRCGIKTHQISVVTRRRVPICDSDVYQGHCIKCDPDNVPFELVLKWEEENPDKLGWAKRTEVHKHRGIQSRQLQKQKEEQKQQKQQQRHSRHSNRRGSKNHEKPEPEFHNSWPEPHGRLQRSSTTESAPQNNQETQAGFRRCGTDEGIIRSNKLLPDEAIHSKNRASALKDSSLKSILSTQGSQHSDSSGCYCPTCGNKIYEEKLVAVTTTSTAQNRLSLNNLMKKMGKPSPQQTKTVMQTQLEPLTIAGAVEQGRCLLCHPNPNHEDGAVLRPPSPPPSPQQQQQQQQHPPQQSYSVRNRLSSSSHQNRKYDDGAILEPPSPQTSPQQKQQQPYPTQHSPSGRHRLSLPFHHRHKYDDGAILEPPSPPLHAPSQHQQQHRLSLPTSRTTSPPAPHYQHRPKHH